MNKIGSFFAINVPVWIAFLGMVMLAHKSITVPPDLEDAFYMAIFGFGLGCAVVVSPASSVSRSGETSGSS